MALTPKKFSALTAMSALTGTESFPGVQSGASRKVSLNTLKSFMSGSQAIEAQADDHTLVLADAGKYIRMTKATATTLTVPDNATVAFPIGTYIALRQAAAGQVTIAASGGVTVNTAETLKLRKQSSSASLIKIATDEWDLSGDLETV